MLEEKFPRRPLNDNLREPDGPHRRSGGGRRMRKIRYKQTWDPSEFLLDERGDFFTLMEMTTRLQSSIRF